MGGALGERHDPPGPQWLSTQENVEADFLSRNNLNHWEFTLERSVFNMILCQTNFGCFCLHSSASLVHDMVQGSPGSCFGCSATRVGPSDLPAPLLGAPGGSSHFESAFGMTHSASGLDVDDLNFLSNHLSLGTQTGYGYVFKRFQNFCQSRGQDPFVCDPTIIVKYIRSLYDGGAAYSTVNHHRSCISKFHAGFGHLSNSSHPMISQAVKAVFHLRPPLPKYINTFDISLVFTCSPIFPDYLQMMPLRSSSSHSKHRFYQHPLLSLD